MIADIAEDVTDLERLRELFVDAMTISSLANRMTTDEGSK
ncbi:hypothetical protein UFOVP1299_29 [uncultured Caudovirales phage]|uniref:Uncharacterized protein n=1 Tax=uncultured Caudovirales phage TaxID=2100421 RepID=A0A6J5RPY7_9CAUD|nr:hypothetical protein UFOVP1299_29 [uncultured Caudovirales phage]